MFFEDNVDDTKYNGHLYGLSGTYANCNDIIDQGPGNF